MSGVCVAVKWEEMDQQEIKLVKAFLTSLSSKDTKPLFYEMNQSDDQLGSITNN